MTNYNKYSSKNKPTAAEIEADTAVEVENEAKAVEEPIVEEKKEVKGIITAPLLNFRSAPNTNANIIDTIDHASQVKIIKEVDGSDWYKIEYAGRTGFVMKSYVEKM